MSTSVKGFLRRSLIIYAALTVFCGLFSYIYEQYSHEVTSPYMTCLFLFPLIGGVVPSVLFRVMPAPSDLTRNLWHPGVATLTLGSCLSGVFEIYGTTAPLVGYYWIAGAILLGASAITYLSHIAFDL